MKNSKEIAANYRGIAKNKCSMPAMKLIVSGIFAKEGDQTEGITERYGGVMYLEPINPVLPGCSAHWSSRSDLPLSAVSERNCLPATPCSCFLFWKNRWISKACCATGFLSISAI